MLVTAHKDTNLLQLEMEAKLSTSCCQPLTKTQNNYFVFKFAPISQRKQPSRAVMIVIENTCKHKFYEFFPSTNFDANSNTSSAYSTSCTHLKCGKKFLCISGEEIAAPLVFLAIRKFTFFMVYQKVVLGSSNVHIRE